MDLVSLKSAAGFAPLMGSVSVNAMCDPDDGKCFVCGKPSGSGVVCGKCEVGDDD